MRPPPLLVWFSLENGCGQKWMHQKWKHWANRSVCADDSRQPAPALCMAQWLTAAAVLSLAISACAGLQLVRWYAAKLESQSPLALKVTRLMRARRDRFLRTMVQMYAMDQVNPELKQKLQRFLDKYKHGLNMDVMTLCWVAIHQERILGVVFIEQMLWRHDTASGTWNIAREITLWDNLSPDVLSYTWNVRALLVDADFRKKGIATMLMQQLIARAYECGEIKFLNLHVDKRPCEDKLPSDAFLVDWYTRFGFRTEKESCCDWHMVNKISR